MEQLFRLRKATRDPWPNSNPSNSGPRGKRYNGEKRQDGGHGDQKSGYQNDNSIKTHERLAEEYKVGPATITRDGQFAAAVDSLAQAEISALYSAISTLCEKSFLTPVGAVMPVITRTTVLVIIFLVQA